MLVVGEGEDGLRGEDGGGEEDVRRGAGAGLDER